MAEPVSAHPRAGQMAAAADLVDVPRLVTAYFVGRPDPAVPAQRVAFGTSGHRGSALDHSFNEWHILAITQAICLYRRRQRFDGPLFIGIDTHALSQPAFASAMETEKQERAGRAARRFPDAGMRKALRDSRPGWSPLA